LQQQQQQQQQYQETLHVIWFVAVFGYIVIV